MRRSSPILVAILLSGLVLRLGAMWAAQGAELVKDERAYLVRGEALLNGHGYVGSYQSWVRHEGWRIAELPQYPGSYQPPGYPSFIAAILGVAGGRVGALRLAQVLLGSASVLLVFALGRRCFGQRAGLFAAALFAGYPNLIAFTHLLWSETLFIALLLGALVLLLPIRSLPGARACLVAGLLLGCGALTRTVLAPLVVVLALWPGVVEWWRLRQVTPDEGETASSGQRGKWNPRPSLRCAAIVIVGAAAVIAPWTIRSSLLHHGFVLIDTNSAYNLWRGNSPYTFIARDDPRLVRYSPPFDGLPLHPVGNLNAVMLIDDLRRDRGEAFPSDLEVVDYASEVAWHNIRSDPKRFLSRIPTKLIDMWNPTSFLLRHFEMGAYGEVSAGWRRLVSGAAVAGYLVVAMAFIAGVRLSWRSPHTWLVLIFIAALSGASALAFGLTRFRLPLLPLMMLPAGLVLDRLFGGFKRLAAEVSEVQSRQ